MKVRLDRDEHSYRLTLDAPPLNILDLVMLEELRDALRDVRDDRHTLVIASSSERAFSAGVAIEDHTRERIAPTLHAFHECFRLLARLDLVTIAFVRGHALGGGCELALACDFVIATEDAHFGYPEISLGAFPPVGVMQMSGSRRGLELVLTGDPIDARTALQHGFITDIADTPDAFLGRLRRHSASSLRYAKRAARIADADAFEAKLAAIERLYLDELAQTADAEEGIAAFMEKRPPRWRGGRA